MRPFIAAAIILGVAMGVGRFAYTPLLVVMEHDAGLTPSSAGTLASINLVGYLIGALAVIRSAAHHRRVLIVIGSAAVVITTATMALPSWAWLPSRFITGVASGVVFVLTVSFALDTIAVTGSRYGAAVSFAGIGLGIAGSAWAVALLGAAEGSRGAWLGLAIASASLLVSALSALPDAPQPQEIERAETVAPPGRFTRLAVAYGLEGLIYIIPATFLVAMLAQTPGLQSYANAAWILVGFTAAPSVLVWSSIARRAGTARAFTCGLLVQAVGLAAALVFPNAFGAAITGISLGASFLGVTALGTSLARDLRPRDSSGALALLTALYGIGQIFGPLIATRIELVTGRYGDALLVAAGTAVIAAIVFAVPARAERRSPPVNLRPRP